MNNQNSSNSIYDIIIRLLFLLLIVGWSLMIMYPFASIILWSLILAIAMFPLHKRLSKMMGGRKKLASAAIVLSILAVIFVPTWLLVDSLVGEVKDLKVSYEKGELSIPPPTDKVKEWPVIGDKLYDFWLSTSGNLEQTIIKHQDQLAKVGSKLVKGILSAAGGIIQIMAALILAGILLIFEGLPSELRKFFKKLAGERGDDYADTTSKTVGNVVKGVLGVALILAVLHGILLMIAGIPYAGIWTLLIFVLGVLQIPLFFVTLPIIVFMFATKEVVPASIWTVLLMVAGTSDNILRPILLGKGAPVPMPVIFIGVIGGFILSGFIGLFTGAIILSIGYKLFIEWVNSNAEEVVE